MIRLDDAKAVLEKHGDLPFIPVSHRWLEQVVRELEVARSASALRDPFLDHDPFHRAPR